MNHKFDELTKGLAQSTTRRQALKKVGSSLAAAILASFGLASQADAKKACLPFGSRCRNDFQCCSGFCTNTPNPYGGPLHHPICVNPF